MITYIALTTPAAAGIMTNQKEGRRG